MTQQYVSFGTVALAAAFATLTLSAPAHAGRMLDLVAKPAQADGASVSRGNSSPRALVSTWQVEVMANNAAFDPASRGRRFFEIKPAQADAASISRGNGSAGDRISTALTPVVAQSRTGVVKSGEYLQRDARCEVRDVCSSGTVGASATGSQPSVQAQGEALTTIR